jgi:tetratricopeptide (TPR) repeat protein
MNLRRWISVISLGCGIAAAAQSRTSSVETIESLLRAHHTAQAIQAVDAQLRTSPRNTDLWTLKGIALAMDGRQTAALPAFDRALQLSPDNLVALRGEVQILDPRGDPRAIPLLHRILALSPQDATAHEMLALYEERSGHCKHAIANFRQSGPGLSRHPMSMAAYGKCLYQTGDTQQAISVFKQMLASFPHLALARYDFAIVLSYSRHYHQALQVMQPQLGAAGTRDPGFLSLAAADYEKVGDTPHAVATLRQAIVFHPKDVDLYNRFAELCLDHQSYKVGIDMLNAGLHYNPRASSLYLSRGLLYAQLSEFGNAQTDFADARRLDPHQGISSYGIDIAELEKYHFDTSHSQSAIDSLRSQLKAHPQSYLLHFLLAKLLTMQGPANESADMANARLQAATAVRLKPDFVAAHDLLALIDLDLNQFPAAADQSRKALRYAPDDRTAVYHLITALRHSSRPQDRVELQSMAKRLGAMERESLQNDTHKRKFRLVEGTPTAEPASSASPASQ